MTKRIKRRITRQCTSCPWKTSTIPERDIPNGYSEEQHRKLSSTIAVPGSLEDLGVIRAMACHHSMVGKERPCVGWLSHQLGPGNNIPLRLKARTGAYGEIILDGPQHKCLEDTLPRAQARAKKRRSSGDKIRELK